MTDQIPDNEDLLLEQLRDLLLRDERSMLAKHEQIFETEQALDARIGPIIQAHLDLLKRNFPEQYKRQVEQIVKAQIANSKNEIISAIYPDLGVMIKRYIQYQFELLRESIAAQIKQSKRSLQFWKKNLPEQLEADMLISEAQVASIEEVFLIKYPAGTIIGHAFRGESLSPDAIAGMLTALKAFVEDAFAVKKQNINLIKYDTYYLLIEHYHAFYFAVLLSGPLTAFEQEALAERLTDFLRAEYQTFEEEGVERELLSRKLDQFFLKGAKT
jgi:hypothetical protein